MVAVAQHELVGQIRLGHGPVHAGGQAGYRPLDLVVEHVRLAIPVDIDPQTFNIDSEKLEAAITALKLKDSSLSPLPNLPSCVTPKGIVAVDLFGLPANYDAIADIAAKHAIFVIDAYAELPDSITTQFLQPVTGRQTQVSQIG